MSEKNLSVTIVENQYLLKKSNIVSVQDLKENDEIWNGYTFKKIKSIEKIDNKDLFLVKTKLGFSLITNKDQKIKILNKENVKIKDVRLDDIAQISINNEFEVLNSKLQKIIFKDFQDRIIEEKTLDKELAFLLGICYRSVAITGGSIKIPLKNISNKRLQKIIISLNKHGFVFDFTASRNEIEIYSSLLVNLLKSVNVQSPTKTFILKQVLNSKKDVQIKFIKGLFDTIQTYEYMSFASSSPLLVSQLQNLFSFYNIVFSVKSFKDSLKCSVTNHFYHKKLILFLYDNTDFLKIKETSKLLFTTLSFSKDLKIENKGYLTIEDFSMLSKNDVNSKKSLFIQDSIIYCGDYKEKEQAYKVTFKNDTNSCICNNFYLNV